MRQKIDLVQLDLQDISLSYPALDISVSEDDLGSQFLLDVIKICGKTRDLILVPIIPIRRILNLVNVTSPQLKLVLLGEEQNILQGDILRNISSEYLNVIVDNQGGEPLDQLLNWLDTVERPFAMFFVAGNHSALMVDFTSFAKPSLKDLYINTKKDKPDANLQQDVNFPTFQVYKVYGWYPRTLHLVTKLSTL